MLVSQVVALWSKPHFQFFPLAIGIAAYLIWRRGSLTSGVSKGRRQAGWTVAILGLLVGGFSSWFYAPWGAQAAWLCLVTAWGLLRLDGPWQPIMAWMTLLWVTLPLPMDLDDRLIRKLQQVSTSSASPLMDLAGVPHLPSGNVIETSAGRLFVDEACSGVDSLYALGAVALFLAVWQRSTPAAGLLTLLTVPAWAWLGNTLRLFLIALLLHHWGMDFAHGWKHTVLGLGVFALMSLFLLAAQGGIRRILKPFPVKTVTSGPWHALFNRVVCWPAKDPARKASSRRKGEAATPQSTGPVLGRWSTVSVAVGLVLVCATSVYSYFRGPAKMTTSNSIRIDEQTVFETFQREDLPEELQGMKLASFETVYRPSSKLFYGEHSAIWQYVDGKQAVQISLDFPFAGFHALEVCYVGAGCEMAEPRRSVDLSEYARQIGSATEFVEQVRLKDQLHGESYLFYAEFDQYGQDVWRLGNRLTGSLPARVAYSMQLQPATFQAQIYLKGCGELTDSERTRYQQILLDACAALQPQIQQMLQAP